MEKNKNKDSYTKILLLVWIILALTALVFGGNEYFRSGPPEGRDDVGVSGQVKCGGGCLYFGVAEYPVGTACRGIQPGDPAPNEPGGVWLEPDYSDNCYVCQSNGSFEEKPIEQCSHCYAQCLGDPVGTQYEDGDQCANGTGDSYAIYTCRMGRWVREEQTKCTGTCPGDGPYTLYDVGHSCYAQGECFQCTDPGAEELGGFSVVPDEVCANDGTLPGDGEAQCRAQCIGDTAERDYDHGDECNAGTEAAGNYGTYVCNNGTWEEAEVQKCVVGNSIGGLRPGDLVEEGGTFKYVGECYQCVAPGTERDGGFSVVDGQICEAGGGPADELPEHSKAGACLGDLNGNGAISLDDFANFARYYDTDLNEENWHYDIVHVESSYSLDLDDFAVFGRNYGKDASSCIQREEDLPLYTN